MELSSLLFYILMFALGFWACAMCYYLRLLIQFARHKSGGITPSRRD